MATSVTKSKQVGINFTPESINQLNKIRQAHPELTSLSAVVRFALSLAVDSETNVISESEYPVGTRPFTVPLNTDDMNNLNFMAEWHGYTKDYTDTEGLSPCDYLSAADLGKLVSHALYMTADAERWEAGKGGTHE